MKKYIYCSLVSLTLIFSMLVSAYSYPASEKYIDDMEILKPDVSYENIITKTTMLKATHLIFQM